MGLGRSVDAVEQKQEKRPRSGEEKVIVIYVVNRLLVRHCVFEQSLMSLKERASLVVQFFTDVAPKTVPAVDCSLIETMVFSSIDYIFLWRRVEIDPYHTGGSIRCSLS